MTGPGDTAAKLVPGELTPLPDTEPCRGCGGARHPLVGRVPCPLCGTVRWTLAITGSRSLAAHRDLVLAAAREGLVELRERMGGWPCRVLHGDAPGVDRILAARLHHAGWPVEATPADWDRHGRRAGILRDLSLVARADALLAIWDGASPGIRHTLDHAAKRELPVACRTVAPQGVAVGELALHGDARVWCSRSCVDERSGRREQHTDSSSNGGAGCTTDDRRLSIGGGGC